MSSRRIAVIGGGDIGRTLGHAWAAAGHAVTFGLRDPSGPKAGTLLDGAPSAHVASVDDAVRDAEVVLFAVPGGAVAEIAGSLGGGLDGRIVLDATNNLGGGSMAAVEAIADAAPEARVFRAFSTLGWENFDRPTFGTERADLFYCGPEGDADAVVAKLVDDVGLRPVRLGDLDQLDAIDGLTKAWFALAMGQGRGRHLAFRLLSD